jgi:serine/threonine protein kinase
MGLGRKASVVYLIDMGLGKRYKDPETGKYLITPQQTLKAVVGTPRYCSLNIHRGFNTDRRDDLIALGYILLHFLRGGLPWQNVGRQKGEDHYKLMFEKKCEFTTKELCAGYPVEFQEYMDYCYGLEFGEDPDYWRLRLAFRKLSFRNRYFYDNVFDWNLFVSSSMHY